MPESRSRRENSNSPSRRSRRPPASSPTRKKRGTAPSTASAVLPSPPRSPTAIQKATESHARATVWTIWYAARYDKVDRVRSILDSKAVASIDTQEYRTKWSALHFAARYGHVEVVQLLLDRGADPDLRDHAGQTPLHLSAGWGNLRCTVLLLEAGAQSATPNSSGLTPLQVATALARHDQLGVLSSWKSPGLIEAEPGRVAWSLDPLEQRVAELQELEHELRHEENDLVRHELHALYAKTKQHGGDHTHPSLLVTLERLAAAYQATGRLERALKYMEQALTLLEELYGQSGLATLTCLNNLGELLMRLERFEESELHLRTAFEGIEALLGETNLSTLDAMENLAVANVLLDRTTSAESLLCDLMERLAMVYDGGWNDRVLQLAMRRGVVLVELKRMQEARRVFSQCLPHVQRLHGEQSAQALEVFDQLGRCAFLMGEFQEAERLFRQTLRTSLSSGIALNAAQHRRLHNNLAMVAVACRSDSAVIAKLVKDGYISYQCDTGNPSAVSPGYSAVGATSLGATSI